MTAPPDRRVFRAKADWDTLRAAFRWQVPQYFNIAQACCDDWAAADATRLAIKHVTADGRTVLHSYGALREASNRLANAMQGRGLTKGDRCAVLLAQSPEVMIAHFGCHKLGMISIPLFTLFGEDGLSYRLSDSGTRVVITDRENLPKILNIKDNLPNLSLIYLVDGAAEGAVDMWADMAAAAPDLVPVRTLAEDPALIIYTSGTTGPPKGALHAHRILLGHSPAVELQHEFFPKQGDIGWTPADWAWIGGLMNIAFACLYYGVPLVSHRMAKFDPDAAYRLMQTQTIRNMFLPPTALKLLRQTRAPKGLPVRTIMSGGESLGAELLDWGIAEFGLRINETYGQTECNLMLTSCAAIGVQKAGAIGRAVPGYDLAIIDAEGVEVPRGSPGEIAVKRGVPTLFQNYWQQPEKTAAKFVGDWMKSGDLGVMDEEGYVTFSSRDDDVITSSGYRIGPTEIEDCLTGHPDVVMAAAVGIPDPVRTEIVKAFVVLRQGASQEGLEAALIERVRKRISPHVAPRLVEVIDAMPMTATGKIMRRELRARG